MQTCNIHISSRDKQCTLYTMQVKFHDRLHATLKVCVEGYMHVNQFLSIGQTLIRLHHAFVTSVIQLVLHTGTIQSRSVKSTCTTSSFLVLHAQWLDGCGLEKRLGPDMICLAQYKVIHSNYLRQKDQGEYNCCTNEEPK